MTDLFEKLAAEFPRDAVHWRAQTLTQAGDKALALAYLDARDVMDRLDSVCTPAGWRNAVTETPKGRLIATIEIKVGDEWVGKTDGAGDTDVEGDKGGISDALKRAAVLWGIGRYLYRLKSTWAPCESTERGGKKYWKAWKGSPWDHVRSLPPAPTATPEPKQGLISDDQRDELMQLAQAANVAPLIICETYKVTDFRELTPEQFQAARKRLNLSIDKQVQEKEAA